MEVTMSTNALMRKRLEAQGFCNLDDEALAEIGPWLRWSPVLCTLVMVVGIWLQSPVVLFSLAAIALFGVFLPFHPFDLLYNHGVRHIVGTRPFPHNGPQRKFACGLASAWLVGTGGAFYAGMVTLGLLLGVALILVAALVSVTNLCIPSMIYNALFGHRASGTP